MIRNSRFAKFQRVPHICKSGIVIPGTAYDTRWANQFHLRGTVAEHRRRQHSPLPEDITKNSMRNPRRNEGMQMQLRNIATRFRVLVSLSLSTACYIKSRIRRAFAFSELSSFLSVCHAYYNILFYALCVYIYISSVPRIPLVNIKNIINIYKSRDILRNLRRRNAII